ncbi:hypothetical protein EKO27_g5734 [Xylaria grammica]|uniref:Serine hydrolase domain-containing protein n=1 Tax=Xylaria grammica TaxID=363999 RepID=A0A439D4M9_9PEZI|nr:hypothetical protein EKO27_g5734 [Xylaria grammica]
MKFLCLHGISTNNQLSNLSSPSSRHYAYYDLTSHDSFIAVLDNLESDIKTEGRFDDVTTFSQGASLVAMLLVRRQYLEPKEEALFRCVILFSPVQVYDPVAYLERGRGMRVLEEIAQGVEPLRPRQSSSMGSPVNGRASVRGYLRSVGSNSSSPLLMKKAMGFQIIGVTELFLTAGEDPMPIDQNGNPTFFLAAGYSRGLETLQKYIDASIDINTKNQDGDTLIHVVAGDGTFGRTPLVHASIQGNAIIGDILARKPKIDAQDR